jgi:hypothetical protein
MSDTLITCPEPIQEYLRVLYDAGEIDAIRRVAEAGPEEWTDRDVLNGMGQRCLVGHLRNVRRTSVSPGIQSEDLGAVRYVSVALDFDEFANEHGILMAAAACSAFARSLLERK